MLDEVEESRLTPVNVVEDDHGRLRAGARLEQLAKRPGDLLGRSGHRLVAENRCERSGCALGSKLLDDLRDRPVADPFTVGETAALDDNRSLESGEELLHQTRFADARNSENREQVADALADDVRECVFEQLALPFAADHRRVVAPLRRLGPHSQQPVSRKRHGLPLGLDRRRLLGLDRAAHEPVRLVPKQHFARLGGLLQPRGDNDRVARGEPLARARDDFAGVEAHAHFEARPIAPLELLVEVGEPMPKLIGRPDRSERIVLVHRRYAEDGHHRVADELLDGAAVPLDDHLRRLEVARQHAAEALGVDPLAERRGPSDVAEEDRDDLAHLTCGLNARERGPARVAEPRRLPILRPATRTNQHQCESRAQL